MIIKKKKGLKRSSDGKNDFNWCRDGDIMYCCRENYKKNDVN